MEFLQILTTRVQLNLIWFHRVPIPDWLQFNALSIPNRSPYVMLSGILIVDLGLILLDHPGWGRRQQRQSAGTGSSRWRCCWRRSARTARSNRWTGWSASRTCSSRASATCSRASSPPLWRLPFLPGDWKFIRVFKKFKKYGFHSIMQILDNKFKKTVVATPPKAVRWLTADLSYVGHTAVGVVDVEDDLGVVFEVGELDALGCDSIHYKMSW